MPVYEPSFVAGSLFQGTVEINGLEICGEDDEEEEFEAMRFYEQRIKPKLNNASIVSIELWDLHCSGCTFNELMRVLSKQMSGLGQALPLREFRFMSHKALQGVSLECLLCFAAKCYALESLNIQKTANCEKETLQVLTDFVVSII